MVDETQRRAFFVPHADDRAQAERVRNSTREFLRSHGFGSVDRRIRRIVFEHNGKPYDLSVGEKHPDLGEVVLVILQSITPDLFYACTPNRGVLGGDPYLIGGGFRTHAYDFDPD